MRYRLTRGDWNEEYQVRRNPAGRDWEIRGRAQRHAVRVEMLDTGNVFRMTLGDQTHTVAVLPGNRPGQPLRFLLDQYYHEVDVKDEFDLLQELLGDAVVKRDREELVSPMPGIIRKVLVNAGETVQSGQPLLILEAMKMENEVRAPIAGRVERIHVKVDQTVAVNDPLLLIVSAEAVAAGS
ncbi:MAG: biotin/lipoyl-containing protein [Planctomycetota bacterium]